MRSQFAQIATTLSRGAAGITSESGVDRPPDRYSSIRTGILSHVGYDWARFRKLRGQRRKRCAGITHDRRTISARRILGGLGGEPSADRPSVVFYFYMRAVFPVPRRGESKMASTASNFNASSWCSRGARAPGLSQRDRARRIL